jgi:hypothetical protein
MPFQTSGEQNRWLPRYLKLYNGRRCHMALGGLSPQQCLQRLLVTECPGEKAHLRPSNDTSINQQSQGRGSGQSKNQRPEPSLGR